MHQLFRLLDSRVLARVGNATTLVNLASVGLGIVVTVGLTGAGVFRVAGWIPLLCFVIWAALTSALVVAWMLRRASSSLRSPAEHLRISRGLPGSTEAVQRALARAEKQGRVFIAEAAVLNPVNNSKRASEFVSSLRGFEAEVAALIDISKDLDHRWRMMWDRKPQWADAALGMPYTRRNLDAVVRYIAQRTAQLGWMIDFLQTGDDEPVRYIEAWVAADARRSATVSAADSSAAYR